MRRTDSLEKILMLGKTEGRRKRGRQRMGQLDDITDSMDMCAKSFQLCPTLGPYTLAHQAPLSTGFSRQKY